MKKLEPKKPENKEPEKVEKPDYTWVWVLIGLLATIAAFYFMNRNKDENGNPETK